MFFNYLKVAFRMIRRQKGYALINIAGLAIGMTVAVLIALWVFDELSYDRFHQHSNRIHRVYVDFTAGTHMILALSMPEFATAAKNELPEVVNAARISRPGRVPVRYQEKEFFENYVCYADNSFFEVFTFPFVAGNPKTALLAPHSAVITEGMAVKYFGDEDPLGKTIKMGGTKDYVINGVVKNVPLNSHFRFHMVLSFETLYAERRRDMENWLNIQYYTYLLLAEGADAKALEQKFPAIIDKYMGETLKSIGGSCDLLLQPLTGIHLFSDIGGDIAEQGDITYVYLFSGIALFVLMLACINFINLATARSASRAREIGMRKTLGSSRKTLIYQFLGESLLYSFFSFLLAAVVIELVAPVFESLIGRPLSVSVFNTPLLMVGFVGLAVFVGVLAGSYPAEPQKLTRLNLEPNYPGLFIKKIEKMHNLTYDRML